MKKEVVLWLIVIAVILELMLPEPVGTIIPHIALCQTVVNALATMWATNETLMADKSYGEPYHK